MSVTHPKKLKILCLHGWNNNIESFTYMTQGLRDQFSEVADFHVMNGPFDIDPTLWPSEPALIAKGFNPPFKSWFKNIPEELQKQLLLNDKPSDK